MLDEIQDSISEDIQATISTMRHNARGTDVIPESTNKTTHNIPLMYEPFLWKGRFWDVPESFEFPSDAKRWIAFQLWVKGIPCNTVKRNGVDITMPIKPFCLFNPKCLPKKIADTFKLSWRPLFSIMEKDMNIPESSLLTSSVIAELYKFGTDNLKERAKYVFNNKQLKGDNWRVSTWDKYIKHNMILNNGTVTDI